ncbi:MAG: hypothetical protein ABIN18_18980 [Pseudomonadota bacterium]
MKNPFLIGEIVYLRPLSLEDFLKRELIGLVVLTEEKAEKM